MTLGEKIKKARLEKKMTQSRLCESRITRNMLSEIENGKASPSFDTLAYIAKRLSLPLAYFLSEEDSPFIYLKSEAISDIKAAFVKKSYKECIAKIEKLGTYDDELYLLLSECYFELGKKSVLNGSLFSGERYLSKALEYADLTVYDTSRIKSSSLIYNALAKNMQSPLLEFDSKSYVLAVEEGFDYDFYRYLIGDSSYEQKNPLFSKHIKAKALIKDRKYSEAIALMKELEEERTKESYNAYVVLGLYTDLEKCYKQLLDFENAYRYASKRLSIIEGFKS